MDEPKINDYLWEKRLFPYIKKASYHAGYCREKEGIYIVGINTKTFEKTIRSFKNSNPNIVIKVEIGCSLLLKELYSIYT